LEFTGLANCLMGHAQRALSTPETEVAQDEWDLTVFGRTARCRSLASASPGCGRQLSGGPPTTLPKRRVRSGRRTSAGKAADLPAAVLADLLGMHINTAVRWVKHVGRDWADYIAARAIEGGNPGRDEENSDG
jgi:hypothetical protein